MIHRIISNSIPQSKSQSDSKQSIFASIINSFIFPINLQIICSFCSPTLLKLRLTTLAIQVNNSPFVSLTFHNLDRLLTVFNFCNWSVKKVVQNDRIMLRFLCLQRK